MVERRINWDLQAFLERMEERQQLAHTELVGRMQSGFNNMERRYLTLNDELGTHTAADASQFSTLQQELVEIKGQQKLGRWLGGAVVVAGLGAGFGVGAQLLVKLFWP